MKDKTKVKAKSISKVAEMKAENPHATYREIAKETGLAHGTIQKANEELKLNGNKDATINLIVKNSKENLKKISMLNKVSLNAMIKDKVTLDENGEMVGLKNQDDWVIMIGLMKEISTIAKDDMARVTIFGGSFTDAEGGYNISKEDMQKIEDLLS